ncbi:hypothetical protein BJ165DRAFT_1471515 [Panaeolus papilionaceus]|nr:hypothetical protein BJ165DRAFT_1471515 [Panaeolus papilionaceus]
MVRLQRNQQCAYALNIPHPNRSMNLQTDCNGLIAFIVQCFFARRVWISEPNYRAAH